MDNEQSCWKITLGFKEMDMSAGDNVDGPRWTGGYVDAGVTRVIVAPSEALARAAALTCFYGHQRAEVKTVEKVCDVNMVVQLTASKR